MTVIQAVVTIGRGLGMEIVAEGVETEAEASVLRLAGVNEIQGFFFSKPISPEAVAPFAERLRAEAARRAQEPAQDMRRRLRSVQDS